MDTREIIKKVRLIELRSRKNANELLMGEYKSSFKGRGMIFSEIRPYQFGDDVRNIDWNTTARYNEPYIKVFEEERELTMILMVDASASHQFGTRKQFKSELITEICATLALSAIRFNDRVGLLLYTEEVELFIPPKKGRKHVLRIIRELINFEPKHKSNNLATALRFAFDTFKRKTNIFVLSDFIDDSKYEKNLRVAAKKHDVAGIRIIDERELVLPDVGLIRLTDNESGKTKLINTSSPKLRYDYTEFHRRMSHRFEQTFKNAGAGQIEIRTGEDFVKPLLNYFKKHSAK